MTDPILEARSLSCGFPLRTAFWQKKRYEMVLHDVNISVERGKTLGLVGESGSGKTTLARAMLGLIPVVSGEVIFYQKPDSGNTGSSGMQRIVITDKTGSQLRPYRRHLQIVFQDPFSSLNPRLVVEDLLMEGVRTHFPHLSTVEKKEKCRHALDRVGLTAAIMPRYPHEFSGGQRQRISIARAIVLDPDLIVCDESVSALDVSVQAQIINLFIDLQEERNLSYLFVSHDLSVVKHISHDIAVLNKGRIVEYGPAVSVIENPQDEYTKSLLASSPSLTPLL